MLTEVVTKQLEQYLKLGLSPIPLKNKVAKYYWRSFTLTMSNMKYYIRPGVNWGLRTGILPDNNWFYVVDIDSKDSLAKFVGLLHQKVPIVSTGKGWHLYLRWSKEVKTRHYFRLDIKGNGYVVAPPSIHSSGKSYRFVVPLGDSIPLVNPETFSPLLIALEPLAKHTQGMRAPGRGQREFKGVQEGCRHTILVCYLGLLFARHHLEEEALAEIIRWNKTNRPPLTQKEVMDAVRSCWEKWDIYEG